MGSSTTPPATREAPPRRSGVLLAAKIVLGVAGLAGCALLGAGGALVFKHLFAARAPVVQAAPSMRTPSSPVAPAPTAPPVAATATPVQATDPPGTAPAQEAPASNAAVVAESPSSAAALAEATPASVEAASGNGDAPVDVAAEAVPYEQLPPTSHGTPRPHHAAPADTGAKAAQADKTACLARVNAITADLSLRSEPPTPQQLAILKRGCK